MIREILDGDPCPVTIFHARLSGMQVRGFPFTRGLLVIVEISKRSFDTPLSGLRNDA